MKEGEKKEDIKYYIKNRDISYNPLYHFGTNVLWKSYTGGNILTSKIRVQNKQEQNNCAREKFMLIFLSPRLLSICLLVNIKFSKLSFFIVPQKFKLSLSDSIFHKYPCKGSNPSARLAAMG